MPPSSSPSAPVRWKRKTVLILFSLYSILSAIVMIYFHLHALAAHDKRLHNGGAGADIAGAGGEHGNDNNNNKNQNPQPQRNTGGLQQHLQRRQEQHEQKQKQKIRERRQRLFRGEFYKNKETVLKGQKQQQQQQKKPQQEAQAPPTIAQNDKQVKEQKMEKQQQQREQLQQQPLKEPKMPPKASSSSSSSVPYLATLNCDAHGGPSADVAQEMVYWKDIPADHQVVSPFFHHPGAGTEQFLTFEVDNAGWNNIRMAMETILAVAFAMGRTLVLPPEQEVWNINVDERHETDPNATTTTEERNRVLIKKKQKNAFSFNDFFHLRGTTDKYKGIRVITTQEFLEKQILSGKFPNVPFPPDNRTDWNGEAPSVIQTQLFAYYRQTMPSATWDPVVCQLAFPPSTSMADLQRLAVRDELIQQNPPQWYKYIGNPVPVDASTMDRLMETRGQRTSNICTYMAGQPEQTATFLHYPSPPRLLIPFYAFVFFEDWKYQLFLNRLIRDTVRYNTEITCAAARVVAALRQRVRDRTGDAAGIYHAAHIRRGDFQSVYPYSFVDIETIHNQLSRVLPHTDPNVTLYIATDEPSKDFFNLLRQHYDVVFLDDFKHELGDSINTNYYGMIDQLIASRSRYFFGCYYSTFSAYINRLRGYHHDNNKGPGYEHGIIDSWYYAPVERFDEMQRYEPIRTQYWEREFPIGWRMSEYKMEEFHQALAEMKRQQEQ